MRISHLRGIALVVLLCSAGLLGWAWSVLSEPPIKISPRPLENVADVSNALDQEFSLVISPTLDFAVRQPLFEASRVPFVPKTEVLAPAIEVPVVEAVLPPEPHVAPVQRQFDLLIKGVFTSPTRDEALVVSPEQPNGKWYVTGEFVAGWKIQRIFETGVTFEADGQIHELKLYVDNPRNTLAPTEQPR